MDYHRLNENIVCNPYQSPIIGDTMQHIKGSKFDMGYYNMEISPTVMA